MMKPVLIETDDEEEDDYHSHYHSASRRKVKDHAPSVEPETRAELLVNCFLERNTHSSKCALFHGGHDGATWAIRTHVLNLL